jgi:hypothetical protein
MSHGGSRPWTAAELDRLGKVPDTALAAEIGRTVLEVRVMRNCRGIPTALDRRRREHRGGKGGRSVHA